MCLGLLLPVLTPDRAQAGSSLAFLPEALPQQVSVRVCGQRSFSPGPRPCQEGASTSPRGSMGGAGAQPFSGPPMYTLTLSLCTSGRHYPQTAAQQQLGESWQKSQGKQGYQLLSWPQLRTRAGQPLGPTCASVTSRHQPAPADPPIPISPPGLSTPMGCALGANMPSGPLK